MKKRKQYTEEFKKDAVRLMLARGSRTVADVAKGLGLGQSLLHRWHQRYGSELRGRATASQHEREDIEKMRRRVRELEQENSLLKKAAALFAKEMK
jgi:transposase